MKVMIVYDSFFGNTEQIARAIAGALGPPEEVGIFKVGELPEESLRGVELLVAGSPTRGFRPSPNMVIFLKQLQASSLQGVKAAAFDTRIAPADITSSILRLLVNVGGYAAKPIADSLVKKGAELAAPPEGFYVKGQEGPLKDGELERAAHWAKDLDKARQGK